MKEQVHLYKVPEGLTSYPSGSYIITSYNYEEIASFLEANLNLYIYDNQSRQEKPDTTLFILDSKKIPEYISSKYYIELLNLILRTNDNKSVSFIDYKGLAICFNNQELINYYLDSTEDLILRLKEEKDWILSGKILITHRSLETMKFFGLFEKSKCPEYDELRTLYLWNQRNVLVEP